MTPAQKAYSDYLASPTWKIIRDQRLALDNKECVMCGGKAVHVHHRRYPKKWGEETILDLVSLCGSCHERHHKEEPQTDWDACKYTLECIEERIKCDAGHLLSAINNLTVSLGEKPSLLWCQWCLEVDRYECFLDCKVCGNKIHAPCGDDIGDRKTYDYGENLVCPPCKMAHDKKEKNDGK
jgi:hypothetical protein